MKKVLFVIDYQVDFCSGVLGSEYARNIEDSVYNKIKEYVDANLPIIFTYDTHYDFYRLTREGKYLPVSHCIKGTEGHDLYGKIKDFKKYGRNITKSNFSMEHFDLGSIVGLIDEDTEIELIGVDTSICVLSNAVILQNRFPENEIIIDASCCASFDRDKHEKALDIMQGLQMQVINREVR